MNLAMFAALRMTDIHEMNALKLVLVTVINGVATATFVGTGAIVWPQALVMLAGAVLGGYTVAHYAQRLPHRLVRSIIIFTGFGMTSYFCFERTAKVYPAKSRSMRVIFVECGGEASAFAIDAWRRRLDW